MNYKCVDPKELSENFIKSVKDWMLLCACDTQRKDVAYNGMTASWGGMGHLWKKDVFWCVVRPQRYTLEFIDNTQNICLSFFDEKYHDALAFCGKESGRDHKDKLKEAGLTPVVDKDGIIDFEEARLTLVGKKIYVGQIDKNGFLDPEIDAKNYLNNDYHKVFVCEITEARVHE